MKAITKWILGITLPLIFTLLLGAGKVVAQDHTDLQVQKAKEEDHYNQLRNDTQYIRDRLDELNSKLDQRHR